MAVILLAAVLIAAGLCRIFPQLNTPTINIVIGIVAVIAGILLLMGRGL